MKPVLAVIVCLLAVSCQPTGTGGQAELMKLESDFAAAVLNNDADAINKFLADNWVIIDADGRVIDKAHFLSVIKAGTLIHDEMELDDMQIRTYRGSAVVTTITTSKRKFAGQAFTTRERATDVFVKQNGRWLCVFSQLTRFNPK